ncbi:hypothetical protein ACN6MY_03725 [Peribacillus sp. B-H-3]
MWFYRPIIEKVVSITEAGQLSKRQMMLLNTALDIKAENEEAAIKKRQ